MINAFLVLLILLTALCGAIAKSAIDQMEKNIQAEADEGIKRATPAPQPAWYTDNCEEVSRTCRARVRLTKVTK